MDMTEILKNQSKETRCYIMSAVMIFEGFKKIDALTEYFGKWKLETLGLTKEDMERFPMPDYTQIVSHLKPISDTEVRHWIITNTYAPVLQSKRADALKTFRIFCSDLCWDVNEIKKSTKLTEELLELNPIDGGINIEDSMINRGSRNSRGAGNGCLFALALMIVSTSIFVYAVS